VFSPGYWGPTVGFTAGSITASDTRAVDLLEGIGTTGISSIIYNRAVANVTNINIANVLRKQHYG
jgi:hypothetical protein